MDRLAYPGAGVALAAFLAGPIFVLSLAFAAYCSEIPAALPIDTAISFYLWWLVLSMPFGFFIAILPCLIGAAAMVSISDHRTMRAPLAWGLVGGLMPLTGTIFFFWHDWGAASFALSATGAACALICRRYAA